MRNMKHVIKKCSLFLEAKKYMSTVIQTKGWSGMNNRSNMVPRNNRRTFFLLQYVRNNNTSTLEGRKENVDEFMNHEDIIKYFEENKHMNIDKLYNLIKSLSKKRTDERRQIIENEKFINIIEEIENRISIMNTRYLCNFSLRLVSISIDNDDIKRVLTKISENIMKKNNVSPRDLVGICYALSLCNNVNEYFFEFIKKESISNIDAYTPTLLTQLLESMRLSQNLDIELTNLIVEKMCEDIDRFTTKDVNLCLKTLSMAGIPRGFLIRRLCNLVFDNISHFHVASLINIIYNLTKLKFTTNNHIDIVYKNVEESLDNCNNSSLSELLYALYMNEVNDEKKIKTIYENINYDHFRTAKTATLIDFIHASTYYLKYVEKEKLLYLIDDILFKRNVPKSLTLIAKVREPIYYLASHNIIKYNINNINSSWLNALNDFIRIDHEKLQALKTFHEVQKVLNVVAEKFHLNFEPLQVIESYSADFADTSKKIVIDIDTIVRHTSFQLKHEYFRKMGYKAEKIHFWKWRKCRSENEQQNYLTDILYSLTEHKTNLSNLSQDTVQNKSEKVIQEQTEKEMEKKKENEKRININQKEE